MDGRRCLFPNATNMVANDRSLKVMEPTASRRLL